MGTLAIQLGGLVMAAGLLWAGVQGLRGQPDSSGRQTSFGVAVACLVLGGLLAVAAVAAPWLMWN